MVMRKRAAARRNEVSDEIIVQRAIIRLMIFVLVLIILCSNKQASVSSCCKKKKTVRVDLLCLCVLLSMCDRRKQSALSLCPVVTHKGGAAINGIKMSARAIEANPLHC